jgi:CRISPR-associated protein Cas2
MTVVVTRDVADRFRGFLASCMLEIAPGVYTSPRMSAGVRDRVWTVCEGWFHALGGGTIVMTWRDDGESGGLGLRTLGQPPRDICDHEAVLLVRHELPAGKANEPGPAGEGHASEAS